MSMSVKGKAQMYRELSKLLSASFPMDKAVAMLLDQHRHGAGHAFLHSLSQGLEQKLGFATAMRQQPDLASEMELNLIDSGERSGHLAEACEHLAHYFETWYKGIREARGALLYPLLLLHAGILLPEISRYTLLSNLPGHEGDASGVVPSILLRLGFFWGGLILLWLAWRSLSRAAVRSEAIDRVLNLLPLVNSVRRHWALARFCQVFHSALLAAMRISECLRLAGEASHSGTFQAGAAQAAAEVERGSSLAEGLAKSQRFSRSFSNAMATAEVSGGLDREFARWAKAETELAVEAQHRVAEWYPKLLYFIILGYIAARIIGFASQYYGALGE